MLVLFPVGIAVVEPGDGPGALPARIGPASRIPSGSVNIDGVVFELVAADALIPGNATLFSSESACVLATVYAATIFTSSESVFGVSTELPIFLETQRKGGILRDPSDQSQ